MLPAVVGRPFLSACRFSGNKDFIKGLEKKKKEDGLAISKHFESGKPVSERKVSLEAHNVGHRKATYSEYKPTQNELCFWGCDCGSGIEHLGFMCVASGFDPLHGKKKNHGRRVSDPCRYLEFLVG